MATTYIKPCKISPGLSAVQTMQDRFAYALDPKKCAAVSSYLCEPETAHAEFMLIKNQYEVITGRNAEKGHLFFQIRQAFPPGEISVEEAQRIGYETVMRWTKGKYQFFVCTHNDTGHLHNHIYYNATAEDSKKKFHNFLGSTFAVRRLSDRICLEHNLSIIANPNQRSKGLFKHYGEWFNSKVGNEKPLTFQERLKAAIADVLRGFDNDMGGQAREPPHDKTGNAEHDRPKDDNSPPPDKPKDFNDFLYALADMGFEHKWGRGGVLSFRAPQYGQERFTRLRSSTLGDGYGLEDIQAVVAGSMSYSEWLSLYGTQTDPEHTAHDGQEQSQRSKSKTKGQKSHIGQPHGKDPIPHDQPRKINLVIDIQEKMQQGKGPAYARWATVHNLKQMAAALQYLQENNLLAYEDLTVKAEAATEHMHTAGAKLQQTETAMKRNAELKSAIMDYARTRPIFEEYKAKKYSNKFLAEHEADIATYRAVQATMKEILQGGKLPKMEALKSEWQTLTAAKKSGYSEYRKAQKDMREVIAVKANIDHLLGIVGGRDKDKTVQR